MNCENCNNEMTQGLYKCNLGSYDIVDNSGNVIINWESHNIDENNVEIGDTSNVHYCQACHIIIM